MRVVDMTARLAVAFALLLCVGGLGLAATINQIAIVDAVNAKLSPDDQFNPFWWYPPKTLRLHREYRRLYPHGGLLRREGVLVAAMLFCIVVVAWLLGFGFLATAWFGGFGTLMLWLIYFQKRPAT